MFMHMKTRCFIEAAKQLNFTRAAEKLYISQPALSKNIAALEEECGMKLFYRDNRKNQVELTPAGKVLLCECQKMQKIEEGIIEKAKRAEAGEEGSMTIALLHGQIINDITLQVLYRLGEEYPKIQVDKISGGFRDLRTWLEEGKVDMAVTLEEEACLVKGAAYEEVQMVQMGFAVPVQSPLAERREISIKDLRDQKIILPDARETFSMGENFRQLCMLEGFIPEEITATDVSRLEMMAELGRGILLTREDSMVTRSPNLKFFPSREMGKVKLVAAWKKENLNPVITIYHRMYEEIYHQQTEA